MYEVHSSLIHRCDSDENENHLSRQLAELIVSGGVKFAEIISSMQRTHTHSIWNKNY